jgi:TolA-binding protein
MKRTERHKLKENEFAKTVARVQEVVETRSRDLALIGVVVVAVLALVAGYSWWRNSQNARANTALASALAIYEAPVVPPAKPEPGSPMPVPQAGTYQTEQAKLEAALPRFLEAADQFPSTGAGIAARFHAAGVLAALGRHSEAEQRYQETIDRAPAGSIYARTARLGLADVQAAQGKFDEAIAVYTELSREANSPIPVDGVLMQLGRAQVRAGNREEAARTFNRIVDEFPESIYAADARQEMAEAGKGA